MYIIDLPIEEIELSLDEIIELINFIITNDIYVDSLWRVYYKFNHSYYYINYLDNIINKLKQ